MIAREEKTREHGGPVRQGVVVWAHGGHWVPHRAHHDVPWALDSVLMAVVGRFGWLDAPI